ncbi:MAG: hypothetical protein RLZZ401_877 [Pseudomonadota bacterium]|jgi:diguanylate cyclase (GGDEF)-like protein
MTRLSFLMDSLGTRARLFALLLLVIIPYSILLIYSTVDRYRLLQSNVREQTLHLAQMATNNQNELVTHTRQLLATLANNPTVKAKDWPACEAMIGDYWHHFKDSYSNFHVADMTGLVNCSAQRLQAVTNIADRKDFKDAVASRQFVVGDLVRSRTSGLLSVMTRYPVVNDKGEVIAVVTGQASTEQFSQAAASVPLPQNGELIITDRGNKVIVHKPGSANDKAVAEPLPDSPLRRAMEADDHGVVESVGLDGVTRVFGFARTGTGQVNGIHVAIGFPLAAIQGEVNRSLFNNVAVMLMVLVLVLTLTWYGVDALLLKKVRILVDTVNKLRDGETSARTGMRYGTDELSHVALAVDETAAELERVLNLLREQTVRDPLTSLFNRRYLEETLDRELTRSLRDGKSVGVIMADIDHFKRINDTFGHQAGDKVLVSVAKALVNNVRSGDIVCRFGGEEFAIIFPGANLTLTMSRAEELRSAVSKLTFDNPEKPIGTVTMSFGVAVCPDQSKEGKALLRHADTALYAAKHGGRNKVVAATELAS